MPAITPDLLTRFDVPGPRYTSYPTADRFVDAFGPVQYQAALEQHRMAAGESAAALSLYVHIPYCQQLCYYCACNKIITRHLEVSGDYLRNLMREIELLKPHLGSNLTVSQMHLGGGTPTFFDDHHLSALLDLLDVKFQLEDKGEYSIEIDPRTVDAKRLKTIKELGFNRLSFGVQDFDPQVQQAVHRIQPFEMVSQLINKARKLSFDSINMDLIYGLPMQTGESFARTLSQVLKLRPDRIALYAYAHLPARFMPQRRIAADQLPPPAEKVGMLAAALAAFEAAGYVYIGMDHFALPEDALAQAKRDGKLHRNFQGYSTQPDCDLIGLGVSAISKIGPAYSQNAKTIEQYQQSLLDGQLPIVRGLQVESEDLIRRSVIMAIMCQGRVRFDDMMEQHGIDFPEFFAKELGLLAPLVQDGLVELDAHEVKVTEMGWFFVRGVAMVFDRYLNDKASTARFSKII